LGANYKVEEQLEILRRVVERMRKDAENVGGIPHGWVVDYANHLLAEIQATKRTYKESING
jgi:hypothetical protein